MYVRVKTTPNSPRKSVQIVQSVRKGNKVSQKIVRYVGIAMNDNELEKLKLLAESIKVKMESEGKTLLYSPEEIARLSLESRPLNSNLSSKKAKTKEPLDKAMENASDYDVNLQNLIEEDRVIRGIHEVYGSLFEEMGYDKVLEKPSRNVASVDIFKHMVLARIANPQSKRGSVEMLAQDFGVNLNLEYVYRTMDKLDAAAIERLKKISYDNTKKLYKEKIDVVFFDCTTLYFEAFEDDELRELGYSKDLKFNQVQVMLALMVTSEGLPIGYEVHPGSTYEGHSLIPAVKKIKDRFEIGQVVFVADAGMMNDSNLLELEKEGLSYIVGAKLKNVPHDLQQEILRLENYVSLTPSKESESDAYKVAQFIYKNRKLMVNYSEKRARKDEHDRNKAIEKLQVKLAKKTTPKDYLSNSGYKKFIKVKGEAVLELNTDKIEEAKAWDGLCGVLTNVTTLTPQEIFARYSGLWQVEQAFRITKSDLSIRPVFHFKPERVKAHLAICFAAYSLVRHLEYRVKLQYIKLSPELIRQTLLRVQTSIFFDKKRKIRFAFPSKVSEHAKKIYHLLNIPTLSSPKIITHL